MGKVISFINMKGGVGKTTLAVNIGYTLSKKLSQTAHPAASNLELYTGKI